MSTFVMSISIFQDAHRMHRESLNLRILAESSYDLRRRRPRDLPFGNVNFRIFKDFSAGLKKRHLIATCWQGPHAGTDIQRARASGTDVPTPEVPIYFLARLLLGPSDLRGGRGQRCSCLRPGAGRCLM